MTKKLLGALALVTLPLTLAACGGGSSAGSGTRDYVSAVGSSTVFPFASVAAERFVATNPGMKNPRVESIGTGGGIERFCAGVGAGTPDIATASRRMKASEFETCARNGVTDIVEIPVGIDGLALGQAANGPRISLSETDIYKALAANPFGRPNTARTWRDVNPALPATPIVVFGPPSTSGTFDSFKELFMTKGCESDPAMKALKDSDKARHDEVCGTLRGSPEYVEQGENDNLIIQKLSRNPNAIGIFGFSYLDANRQTVRDVPINGTEATVATVTSGQYPGSRILYLYVKKAHVGVIPGITEYLKAFLDNAGAGGLLAQRGLVPLHSNEAAQAQAALTGMTPLSRDALK